eukprot:maker-scaffold785_size97262-snap-gene-0.15 protein:Tk00303 transcript:maker-scaffold785_size97262-snap-gene-0.15-mRNA-1 annotation:"unnamed protein product"
MLGANTLKTSVMMIPPKGKMDPALLKIGGSSILPCSTMKLLGITLQANLGWTDNVAGLVTSLNQRVGLVRRLLKWIPRSQIQPIVDGLVISKLRYGLPDFGQVRLQDTDPTHGNMKKLQGVLNDLMRLVANKRISDKISCVDLSEMTGIPSLNRICASATLKELKRASDLGWPLADVLEPAKTCYGMGLRSQTSKLARCQFLFAVLNDLMRLVANKRISDKISCVDLSEMTGIPSLNRICASATLKELKRASDLGWPLADFLEPAKTCYGMGLRSQTSKLAPALPRAHPSSEAASCFVRQHWPEGSDWCWGESV